MALSPKLRAYWYQKLKESGFRDIERKSEVLTEEIDQRTLKRALSERSEREAYFAMCSDFLYSYTFKSEEERRLWELHSDGWSVRRIANEIGMKRPTVHVWIKRLRKAAGIK